MGRRLKQHRRERGDIAQRTGGGSRGRKIDRARLAELARRQPDATLVERATGSGQGKGGRSARRCAGWG